MKLIIAGSRTISPLFSDLDELLVMHSLNPTEIVNGRHWEGVDDVAWNWAGLRNYKRIPFPAKWTELGRSAGPIRNAQMAEYADILLLIWDGKTSGSANMKLEMTKRKKQVIEVIWSEYKATRTD